jgi:hypothetical protein
MRKIIKKSTSPGGVKNRGFFGGPEPIRLAPLFKAKKKCFDTSMLVC